MLRCSLSAGKHESDGPHESRSGSTPIRWQIVAVFVIVASLLRGNSCRADEEVALDFETQVRPLLIQHCGECHGPTKQQCGLRLDVKQAAFRGGDGGPVILPADGEGSELWRRVTSEDESERMPPEGPPLGADELAVLRRWLNSGAPWPESEYDRSASRDPRREHWSFQPLRRFTPPGYSRAPQSAGGSRHPEQPSEGSVAVRDRNGIDAFVAQALREQRLSFSPPADRRTLIRRLSLDLLGLPPTPEQVARFVRDPDALAYDKLVDEFLLSPRYGERWAQHWLDVIRYADTHGFEVNTPRDHAWPYRDYVIRAFNDDCSYDQFVREQLVGDAYHVNEATGFLVAAAVLLPGQIGADDVSKRLARQDALDEIIAGTSSSLLGLTLACARCHDHKFDPLTQRDYYAMQAFFAGVEYGDRALDNPEQRARQAAAAQLRPLIEKHEAELARYEPVVYPGRTYVIDTEDATRFVLLQAVQGRTDYASGRERGQRDDPGDASRVGNLSDGSFARWQNQADVDVLAYRPLAAGRFRLWLSWGVPNAELQSGDDRPLDDQVRETPSNDVRYWVDRDGQLTTTNDQTQVALVDQSRLAGIATERTAPGPLWSGLLPVGEVMLDEGSLLLVRGGATGTVVTADAIVLQEITESAHELANEVGQPLLRAPLDAQQNIERFAPVVARFVRFTVLSTLDNNLHEPCLDELEVYTADRSPDNVALADSGAKLTSSGDVPDTNFHRLSHLNDGQFGNGRSWISDRKGEGWVQLELHEALTIDRIVWSRDRTGEFRDRLPVTYVIETSIDGSTWQRVAGHDDRLPIGTPYDTLAQAGRDETAETRLRARELADALASLRQRVAQLEATQLVYAGVFREPDPTFVLRRGDPEQRLDAIDPVVPELFGTLAAGAAASEQQRRQTLANWIASPENPLTARVLVNRLWLQHFGRGLVTTPSDFGCNGSPPSHPELLDWLAQQLIEHDWSIKAVQRLIVTSATYRQSNQIDPQAIVRDRDNQWLWRFASRRLESEAIRDAMLCATAELNLTMSGPGFSFFDSRGGLSGFQPVEKFGPDGLRRMIYAHKVRMEHVPVFGAFDCPDAGQSAPQRSRSTTAIQALNLFNSDFVGQRSAALAERIQREAPSDVGALVARAFELTLTREPSATERDAAVRLAQEHGLPTLCRVLLNCNEFVFMP